MQEEKDIKNNKKVMSKVEDDIIISSETNDLVNEETTQDEFNPHKCKFNEKVTSK